jgi:hypothetical protein
VEQQASRSNHHEQRKVAPGCAMLGRDLEHISALYALDQEVLDRGSIEVARFVTNQAREGICSIF